MLDQFLFQDRLREWHEEDLRRKNNMDKIKILVADDDPIMQGAYKRMLDKECDVQVVADGLEALHLIRRGEFKPDVIVSDYDMGIGYMSGMGLCSTLRKEGNNTPFLLISGCDNVRDLAKTCGADFGLSKPFSLTEEFLRRVINRKKETPDLHCVTTADGNCVGLGCALHSTPCPICRGTPCELVGTPVGQYVAGAHAKAKAEDWNDETPPALGQQ